MTPHRVLMTADTVGGVWTYAIELVRALPEIEFALATMGAPPTTAQEKEVRELPNVTVFPSTFALEWMEDPWSDVDRAGKWLQEIASEFLPDLIHLNGYVHAALPWQQPVLVVGHSCVLSWFRAVRNCNPPAAFEEYRRRVVDGLRAADLVAAPTRAMLDSLRENYDFFGGGVVLPNARDASLFAPAEKEPTIFSAGRLWDDAKNLVTLDAAAPHVRWPVTVAGDTTHPNGRERRFEHVHSLGRLTPAQLRERFASSAIYALPARYEPFGLSALEAAISGCALVLGDITSLREVWGDAARFVAPDDPAALAAVLNELIADSVLRDDMSRRAAERAREFSPARMAAAYRAAYADCASMKAAEVTA
jgi:glycosyltransferase involved in cell wall biosynthesis